MRNNVEKLEENGNAITVEVQDAAVSVVLVSMFPVLFVSLTLRMRDFWAFCGHCAIKEQISPNDDAALEF